MNLVLLRRNQRQIRLTGSRGMSLVELMVGIALSMMTVLAAMTAYKALINNSLSSSANSKTQNVGATLSVQLSKLLPQAGWGVGAAAAAPGGTVDQDVVLLTGASLSGSALSGTASAIGAAAGTGNAIVWDSAISGTLQCSALLIPSAGSLILLGPIACAKAAVWSTLSWTTSAGLLPADSLPGAAFAAQKSNCWPYASVAGGQSAIKVSLTGVMSTATAVCLTNITN